VPFDISDAWADYNPYRDTNHRWTVLSRSGAFARDVVVSRVQARACALAGVPVSQLGTTKMHCYRKGEFFKPHFDFFPEGDNRRHLSVCFPFSAPDVKAVSSPSNVKREQGQVATNILVYLNTLPDGVGGGTIFHRIGKKVRHLSSALTVRSCDSCANCRADRTSRGDGCAMVQLVLCWRRCVPSLIAFRRGDIVTGSHKVHSSRCGHVQAGRLHGANYRSRLGRQQAGQNMLLRERESFNTKPTLIIGSKALQFQLLFIWMLQGRRVALAPDDHADRNLAACTNSFASMQ
jgi:hypothetical protein